MRDLGSLRNRFDNHCNQRNTMGSKNYPPIVGRAEKMARDIKFRAAVCAIFGGGEDKGDEERAANTEGNLFTKISFATVGARENRKTI